jgi:tripeptidyl-peptidase-1
MATRAVLLLLSLFTLSVLASHVEDWVYVEPADEYESLTFYVALKQRNLDKLEELLYAVSDPRSAQYGRRATEEEIGELVYPPQADREKVYNFLVDSWPEMLIIDYGDAYKITASVGDIAEIFSATFHWYRHTPSGHLAIRADLYGGIVIPKEIENYVQMVTGLATLPIIMKKNKVTPISEVEDTTFGYFAPSTIRRIYNIPPQTTTTNPQSSQCALEFAPEGAFTFSDFSLFCQLSDEKFYNYTHIVGPFEEGQWGNTESELDVQVLGTIGSGAENWFWTITDGWIYEMAVDIFNNETKPWIFSISYGWPEVLTCNSAVVQADCGTGDNANYIGRANAELAKLGTLRISIITCSQDEGAPSEANMYCQNNTHPVFGIYPGSSPYVTSVSGTAAVPDNSPGLESNAYPPICYQNPCSNSTTEQTCMQNNTAFEWTTGGGFSEITLSPPYQTAQVAAYLASKAMMPPKYYFWPKNRGYPDIAAIGARVLIVSGGEIAVAEGTSASTPIIAGLTTLLNDYRFNAGKTALGFLNPVLYQMPSTAFNDVTVGSNECTEGSNCCTYGYGATTGWDAVSGLGSPNFGEMLNYVKTLP